MQQGILKSDHTDQSSTGQWEYNKFILKLCYWEPTNVTMTV